MGAAIYVVLRDKNAEAQPLITGMNGKALSSAIERLEDIAERLEVTPLMKFFSEDPENLAALLGGDDFDDEGHEGDEGDEADEAEARAPARKPGTPVRVEKLPSRTADAGADDSEGEEAGDDRFVEDWFDAADGLRTVTALIEHLHNEPDDVDATEKVLADLGDLEKILTVAEAAKTPFHVAMDF